MTDPAYTQLSDHHRDENREPDDRCDRCEQPYFESELKWLHGRKVCAECVAEMEAE